MIAIDTSALIAVINGEPERQRYLEVIAAADRRLISGVTVLETRIVAFSKFEQSGVAQLTSWMATFNAEIIPFDRDQAFTASGAFRKFGKGIHPKARLNFGDCASYALAKTYNIPLLYKGDDFAATDIQPAA